MGTQIPLSSCIVDPITPQLWSSLGIDDYLRNYPSGQNMTLIQYARQVHAANFICGLGRHCLAGQPCVPVAKSDWLVLYSVQQWNFYMNSLYDAIQNAITIVRDAAASAIADFTPINTVKWMGLTVGTGVLAVIVLAAASALLITGIQPFTIISEAAIAEEASVEGGTAAAAASTAAVDAPKLVRRSHKELTSTDKLAAYAKLNGDIGTLQSKLNRVILSNMNSVITSPISSDLGIYNVVKNATYLNLNPNKSELQQSARKLAQLTMISELFKSLKMFVVVGNEPCTGDGPNGALSGKNVLSYCSNEKLMMNIVRADSDKMNKEIPNGNLLSQKYGFETKYLISMAWSCQEKFQLHKNESAKTFSTAKNNTQIVTQTSDKINGDCAFTIPVCDTRLPNIRKMIDDHQDVVIACREGGNLNI